MRPVLRLAIPLALAAAALFLLWRDFRARSEELALRAERAQVKREMVERGVVARALAADRPREAAEEGRALLRWYFDELQAARNRHPGVKPPGGLAAMLAQRPKATEEEKRTLEEFHRYADERLQALRAGRHDPLFLAGAAGLRLDVLAIQPGKSPVTGEPGVRIDFALWGPPRRTDREAQPGGHGGVERAALVAAFPQLALRFLDADGKPYGEMLGSGEPYLKLADPERFAADFPPGLLFGSWWVEPFPREAARVAVTLQLSVGGNAAVAVTPTFAFEAPVAEGWKLPPGQAFQGATREDPSLAPAPRGKKR
jgi:hypothetical protein